MESTNFIVDPSLHLNYVDPISGKVRNAKLVAAVDELVYKVRKMDIWQTVDFCLRLWAERYPVEHKLFLEDVKRYRANRANKYASTKSKSMRELLAIPPLLSYLLNKIAQDKIDDYGDAKFKREFARRYSGFRVGEKF